MRRILSGSLFTISTLSAALVAACGGEEIDVTEWEGYGGGIPGANLPEGGEMLIERISISPAASGTEAGVVLNTFHAFQYGGSFMGAQVFPAPGTCHKMQHPINFPVHDIPDTADYVDWGESIVLNGPGMGSGVTIPKVIADGTAPLTDNRPSPVRNHKEGNWIYGGPTWQGDAFQGVTIEPGGTYNLDINVDRTLEFQYPPEFAFAENAGREEVIVPVGGDWDLTWEAKQNPNTPHDRGHSFVFVAFAQFPGEGDLGPTPLYLRQPPEDATGSVDGSFTIPQSVIDDIPEAGIFQTGRFSHWMEILKDDSGADRKLDLFAIECSVSTYSKAAN